MGDPFHIRDLERGDLVEVVGIERRSFSDPWSEGSFAELLAGGGHLVALGAVGREGVIGYLLARDIAGTSEIMNLAVDPATRGTGVGQALLEAGVSRLAAAGSREIYLEVRESNRNAIVLYQRNGFNSVGMRRAYYERPTEDALVLRRVLDEHA